MSKPIETDREETRNDAGWDATTVLVLVGMIALAIAVGLVVT